MTIRASAGRYARALFDVAKREGHDLERIEAELSGVVSLVRQHDQLQRAFASPAIPAARKRAVVEQLLSQSAVNPVLARVLLLLADRDRLVLLPELEDAYRSRLMDHQNIVRASVTTAVPLPEDRVTALQHGLSQASGRTVSLDVRIDPALVGGAIARIGSTVYDGSVMTQLEKLRQQLGGAQI